MYKRQYIQMGDERRAEAAYKELIAKYPESELAPDAQLNIAISFYDAGNYQQAIAEFQKVVERYPGSDAAVQAQFYIGRAYYRLKSYSQAVKAFLKVDPKSEYGPAALYFAGWCLFDKENPRRDLKRAVELFRRVVAEHPKSPEAERALLAMGRCYEEMGELDEAAKAYSTLIERYPRSAHYEAALLALGTALLKQGKHAEAVKAFDRILNDKRRRFSDETIISALLFKAEALAKMGRDEEAAETYLRMALVYDQIDPDSALTALIRAGECYERLKRWEDAKTWFRRAVKQFSSHPKRRKGWEKRLEYARRKLEELEKLHPSPR
mgnify:FL=1